MSVANPEPRYKLLSSWSSVEAGGTCVAAKEKGIGRSTEPSVNRVVSVIADLITTGRLGPGEQLRQEDLATRLEVSRVPVREALHVLNEQGLIMHERHRGFFVAKRSGPELGQIARMLELLETELLRTIVWPDEIIIGKLRALNDVMADLAKEFDWTDLVPRNREFHFEIFKLSPHELILREVKRLWSLADPHIVVDLARLEDRLATVAEHTALIDALEAKSRTVLISRLDSHRSKSAMTDRGGPLGR
jgi:DNA-binding GntR family transcriptional regulator